MDRHRRPKFLATISLLCALVGCALIHTAAQNPQQPPIPTPSKSDRQKKPVTAQADRPGDQQVESVNETIIIDTGLVQLDVSVIDQTNTPVFNLNKDSFMVYEDKIKQVIESVSREESPISFGLVIDTSGSMRGKIQTVTESAISLIKQMRHDDEGFIAQFRYDTELVRDFTRDKRQLENSLGTLDLGGGTALLDAIIATADYTTQKAKLRRKALIIFSDGLEKNSLIKEKEVMRAIRENEVQLYLIGFLGEEESNGSYLSSENKKAKELLKRLADDSGGRAFFPNDLEEIPAIATQIARDLRTQYIVRYYPSNEKKDGTFRSVSIVVNSKDTRKLIARTRLGYYARTDKELAP